MMLDWMIFEGYRKLKEEAQQREECHGDSRHLNLSRTRRSTELIILFNLMKWDRCMYLPRMHSANIRIKEAILIHSNTTPPF